MTTGNPAGHVVLRGGRARPNYEPGSIREAETKLAQAGVRSALMVDCSHANSLKQHARQEEVWKSLIEQRVSGTHSIIGAMIESYLGEGNQNIPADPSQLQYGVSVTDACLGWIVTERMLRTGHEAFTNKPAEALRF